MMVSTAARTQGRHLLVDGFDFIEERQAGNARRRHDGRRFLERQADEADAHAVHHLDAVRREDGLAGCGLDHVGREELELRAPSNGTGVPTTPPWQVFASVG